MARINWTEEELLLAAYWYHKNGYKTLDDTSPEVQELAHILQGTSFHPLSDREVNFRSPNSVSLKIRNIADTERSDGPSSNGSKGDGPALRAFRDNPEQAIQRAERILEIVRAGELAKAADVTLDGLAYEEGGLLLVEHYKRERSTKLRSKKISAVLAAGEPIACEVCAFNFEKFYGERGRGYIEVHHKLPLHVAGQSQTRLQDLALLCANCHRMIHNKKTWLTPDELKALIKGR